MKFYQMLHKDENHRNEFVFTTDSFLAENFESIKNVSSVISILVIECQQTSESDKNSVYQNIHYMLDKNKDLKLILIATMNNNLVEMFIKNYSFDEVKKVNDNFIWDDLTDESKFDLLSSEIIFQGGKITLKNLTTPEKLKDIGEQELSDLALKNNPTIGVRPESLSEVQLFYIKLFQKIDIIHIIDALTIISNESTAYLFSGVKSIDKLIKTLHSDDLKGLRDVIELAIKNNLIKITDEMDDEILLNTFKQICKDCNEKIVYWLELKKGNWYLKRIYQPKLYIDREFIISPEAKTDNEIEIISDNDMQSVDDKVVLLSDGPGMGKTTSFIKILNQFKNSKPSAFVLNINLRISEKMISKLSLNDTDDDFDEIINFLLTLINEQKSTLSSIILKNMLNSKHHSVYLFFDGFDEISESENQDAVIKLLKYLKDKTDAKVWLSTRPLYLTTLKSELNVCTINFQEFNSIISTEYITNFYESCLKLCFKSSEIQDKMEKCESYVSSIINHSSNTFIGGQINFLRVPLQLRILAEGFMDNCLNFLISDEKYPTTESINLLHVYKKFITAKYEIYFKEKISYTQDKVNKLLSDSFNHIHQILALKLIYSNKLNVQNYLEKHFPNEENISIAKSIGIVQSIGEDGEVYFIHRTFAEYFIAQFIVVNIVNNSDSERNLLAKELYSYFEDLTGERVIQTFVDYLSIEDLDLPLHSAIINQDTSVFCNLFPHCLQIDINATDKLKRNPLHLATIYKKHDFIDILIHKKCNMYAADIFGKNVLHYRKTKMFTFLNQINTYDYENLLKQPSDFKKSLQSEQVSFVNQKDCFGQSPLQLMNTIEVANNKILQYCDNVNQLLISGADFSEFIKPASTKNGFFKKITKVFQKNNSHKYSVDIMYFMGILILETSDSGVIKLFLKNDFYLRECFKQNYIGMLRKILPGNVLSESLKFKGLDILKSIKIEYYNDEDYLLVVKFIINRDNRDECLKHVLQMCLNYGYTNTFNYFQNNYHDFLFSNIWDCFKHAVNSFRNHLIDNLLANHSQWLKNENYFTVLHFASAEGQLKLVKYLVSKGADLLAKDDYNLNAVDYSYINDQADVFEYFITKCHLSVHLTDEFIDKITKFLTTESNVNDLVDENDATLLHLACKLHKSSFVKLLINRGADINRKDKLGRTPMHYSALDISKCDQNKCMTVPHLMSASAIYNTLDYNEKTPLDIMNKLKSCLSYEPVNCYDALIKINELFTYLITNNYDSFESLLSKVTSIFTENVLNVRESHGNTLLHFLMCNLPDSVIRSCANVQNDVSDTPLHLAVRHGNVDLVENLMMNGANIYMKNNQDETPLQIASVNQNNTILSKFNIFLDMLNSADEGEDSLYNYVLYIYNFRNPIKIQIMLNAKYDDGSTLLHLAVKKDFEEVVRLVLTLKKDYPVDLNAVDNMNRSPLHYAALNKNDEIINLLLNQGCCYNLKDFNNKTPFDLCNKSDALALVNLAFDVIKSDSPSHISDLANSSKFHPKHYKYALSAVDNKGKHLSHYTHTVYNSQDLKFLLIHGVPIDSLIKLYFNTSEITSDDLVEVLFSWKYDIFHLNTDSNKFSILSKACLSTGETLLHLSNKLPINIVKKLIKNGADVNSMHKWGGTPLHIAAYSRKFNLIELLIKNGANINAKNVKQQTPLLMCITTSSFIISCFLLENGADVNTADDEDVTPLMSVNYNEFSTDIVTINILIKYGVDINAKNLKGETALFYAIKKYDKKAVNILLEHGADVNSADINGVTPLMFVCNKEIDYSHEEGFSRVLDFDYYKCANDMINILVDHGADLNAIDLNGYSALVYTIINGGYTHLNTLLKRGADTNAKIFNGESALVYVVRNTSVFNAGILLQNGADVKVRSKDGFSLLELVDIENDNGPALFDLLLQYGAE
ncbi:hypothetical protein CHUAL_012078 [Chamberlinius hualienensis]